jgi:hypothetical protein
MTMTSKAVPADPGANVSDMFGGGDGIRGVQEVLSGRPVRRFLRRELSSILERGVELGRLRIRRVKFKPDRKLTTHFDVSLNARSGKLVRQIVVTWSASHPDPAGLNLAEKALDDEAAARGLSWPFRSLSREIPRHGLRIVVSPMDPRTPELMRLTDPGYVASLLATAYGSTSRESGEYRVRSIRYRPGERHVLRYDPVPPTDGSPPVFAKTSRDQDVDRSFRITSQIADWLERSGGEVRASRPLAAFSADRVILYPRVPGQPLSRTLARSTLDPAPHLHRVGTAARLLHQSPEALAEDLRPRELSVEIQSIARASEHVQQLLPAVGATIHDILRRAKATYPKLPNEAPTFTHGDFKADHVWVTRTGLTILDFDTCGLSDPAVDVGKFLADLDWAFLKAGRPGLGAAQAAFLSGYASGDSSQRLARARLFEVLVLVKSTVHRVALFDPNWASRTRMLIRHADRLSRALAVDPIE